MHSASLRAVKLAGYMAARRSLRESKMTPAIGYLLAGLFAAAPMAHDSMRDKSRAYQALAQDVIYECPETYKLAKNRAGEVICLRYRRDLVR
jgi:hypothetical protein